MQRPSTLMGVVLMVLAGMIFGYTFVQVLDVFLEPDQPTEETTQ